MSTAAQIRANKLNAHRSTGPVSEAGKKASSRNRATHGLCRNDNTSFYLLEDEDSEEFRALRARLVEEYKPETETERILVRRLADHEWLRTRALRLQQTCLFVDQHVLATEQFGLYMRYQTTHERAFYKALAELQKLQAAKNAKDKETHRQPAKEPAIVLLEIRKQEEPIGFEPQSALVGRSPRTARDAPVPPPHASHPAESQKQASQPLTPQNTPAPAPETGPNEVEMAA